jgi:methanogenic corrinoid protein MtbC1
LFLRVRTPAHATRRGEAGGSVNDDAPVRLYQAFVEQDPAAAIRVIESARTGGTAQEQLFDSLFAPALALLGAAWASGEVDEFEFTRAAVVAEQVTSFVTPPPGASDTGVAVIVGCMHGDHHGVLKNIIGAALKEAGNRVADVGLDASASEFLAKVDETGAGIVVVCAEMLEAAGAVEELRALLAAGGHPDVVLFVAGGPFEAEPELARASGANGVLRGAESAIRLVARAAADRSLAEGAGS